MSSKYLILCKIKLIIDKTDIFYFCETVSNTSIYIKTIAIIKHNKLNKP